MCNPPTLTATYTNTSSSNTKQFRYPLKTPQRPTSATESKVAFLNSLRQSTKQLQNDVNEFLTAKMEEDKAAAATTTASTNGVTKADHGAKPQDEEEEENYGEEAPEED